MHIEIHMITYLIRSCTRSHLQYKQWTNVDHPVTFMNFNCLFRPACRFFAWSYVDRFLSWFWGQKGQKRCISKYIQKSWTYNYEVTIFFLSVYKYTTLCYFIGWFSFKKMCLCAIPFYYSLHLFQTWTSKTKHV